jgi:hypothetical protein
MKSGNTNILESVLKGIGFLSHRQSNDGGFASKAAWAFNCSNDDMGEFVTDGAKAWVEEDPNSVFPSILIGMALLSARGMGEADKTLEGIGRFLVENRYRFGLWQHFTRNHPFHHVNPCDVDDTSMASHFLREIGVRNAGNRRVLLANRTKDGLFYTWFAFRRDFNSNAVYIYHALRELRHSEEAKEFWDRKECSRDDVDAVVNANVLSYLGLDSKTSSVVDWIERILAENKEGECDKWYRNLSTVYYFFSRAYRPHDDRLERIRQMIRDRVLSRIESDGRVDDHPLDTALSVSTLLNLDCKSDIPLESMDFLLQSQSKEGWWKRKIFYYGGPKKLVGWGGEEITTAFCLESIIRLSDSLPDLR